MIKPYYQDEYATIYHADCREVLPHLEKVDLVITDPPFAEKTHKGARSAPVASYAGESQKKINFNSMKFKELREVFNLISLAANRWVISSMDWRHIYKMEKQPPTGLRFIRFGVWVKPNGAPQFTGDRPATGWEGVCILHSESNEMFWNDGGHRAVWTENTDNSGLHPTAKPLKLYSKFIKQFGGDGTILDPFMGSGTSLRAAKNHGLKSIGIEISEKYCEIAARRLAQGVLNFEPEFVSYRYHTDGLARTRVEVGEVSE